jgi:hypothetical protein
MNSPGGAQTVLVPSHDPSLLVFFVNLGTNYDSGIELSQGEYRKYVREVFQDVSVAAEKLGDRDLWIPNFRVKAVVDNTLQHTLRSQVDASVYSLVSIELTSDSNGDIIQTTAGDGSIVLGDKFIFGLIETIADDKFGLPLMSMLVTRENFVPV